MDARRAVNAAGLLLTLGILLTLLIRVTPEEIQAAADPQRVTVSRVASTGMDIPISTDGGWAQATITIDDVPAGALVKGVNLKYKVSEGLQAADLDVQISAPGSDTSYALSASASGESAQLEARGQLVADIEAFNGQPVNGDWTLAVRQRNTGQEGYLDSFSISVEYETDMLALQEEGEATGRPGLFQLPSDHPAATTDDEDKVGASEPEAPATLQAGWQLIAAENFEGTFPNTLWDVTGGWDDASCPGRHTDGSWAAWCADQYASSCSDTYDNDRYDWMVYGPFDLSDATDARVEFDLWMEIEPDFDRVAFGVSSNGTNFSSVSWDGFQGWQHHTVYFTDWTGDSSVWIAFIFQSDSSMVYEGAWVDQIELWKELDTPAAPSNLNATAVPDQCEIRLSWKDNSDNEDGFDIIRDGSHLISVGANVTSYTDDAALTDGQNYCYYVVARNSSGTSDPSNSACATADCPGPQRTIMCENFEGSFPTTLWNVTGGWDDASCPERHTDGSWAAWCADEYASSCSDTYDNDRYDWMIYGPFDLSDATDAWAEFDLWMEIEPDFDRVAFGVSSNGTDFTSVSWGGFQGWEHYKVYFTDWTGDSSVWVAFIFQSDSSMVYEGAWVDQICLYKMVIDDTPAAPSNLNATAVPDQCEIDLSWNDNSDNEDGFDIYRDGSYLTSVGANVTSYTDDAGLVDGQSYCYYVVAHNSSGSSSASNTDCARADCPSCPTTVRIDPDPASISGGGTVCVYIDSVTDLGGFEFDLLYNPGCVEVDDVVLGPFPGTAGRTWAPVGPTIDNGAGVATFGGFSFGSQPGDTGSGCMAEVTLDCQTQDCTSVLNLENVDIVDPAANPMCTNVQDGQVDCSPCPWPPDFDGDDDVDVADIMHCASKWGCQCGDGCYDPCCDFDKDCDIDVADIMQVAAQWGWTGP